MILAGVIVGTAFAGLGALLYAVWSGARVPLAIVLGAVTLLYAVSEIGFISLPVPGRSWQVPADWVREGFYRSAVIFGGTVGFGVFTRVPYASFPIMLAWLFVSGNVLYGAIAGLVYGTFRAASIYSSSSIDDTEALVHWNQRIMAFIPSVHVLTGSALAVFGLYLVIAPVLD